MRHAAIDLGSNSFLCLITEYESSSIKEVHDQVIVTRMGEGLHQSKEISKEALIRIDNCLNEFHKKISEYQVDTIQAVATSAARDANNFDELLKIGNKYNIPIKVISGSKEAQLTFLGAYFEENKPGILPVIDIGGGSTEIVTSNDRFSFDIGSVRFNEKFHITDPRKTNWKAVDEDIIKNLTTNNSINLKDQKSFIGVAGTPQQMACLIKNSKDIKGMHNQTFTIKELENLSKNINSKSFLEIKKIPYILKGREDVTPMGIRIMLNFMKFYNINEVIVSRYGIRFGVAKNYWLEKN